MLERENSMYCEGGEAGRYMQGLAGALLAGVERKVAVERSLDGSVHSLYAVS